MKLLCLNVYGGKLGQPLFDFIKEQAYAGTDIFCFQEVFRSPVSFEQSHGGRVHLFNELQQALPNFRAYFEPYARGVDTDGLVNFELEFGQATFITKELEVVEFGKEFIFGSEQTRVLPDLSNEPKILQFFTINFAGPQCLIVNVHGAWHPSNKLDNKDRLLQSEKINSFLAKYPGAKILCGDFNLFPHTQSVKMLEQGMKNLIVEYNIKSTRNMVSLSKYPNNPHHFADYIFVSPQIKVKNFEVPYNEVSDHLPLILDFEL